MEPGPVLREQLQVLLLVGLRDFNVAAARLELHDGPAAALRVLLVVAVVDERQAQVVQGDAIS